MLISTKKIPELTNTEQLTAVIRGWIALCPDTGAFLSVSHGRTKWGDTKYVLILPNKTPQERGGLFTNYDWNYPGGRKFVRAFSDDEAIQLANKKLNKMTKSLLEAQS